MDLSEMLNLLMVILTLLGLIIEVIRLSGSARSRSFCAVICEEQR